MQNGGAGLPVSPGGHVGGGTPAVALALSAGATGALVGGTPAGGALALGEGVVSVEATGAAPLCSSFAQAERASIDRERRAVVAKGNRMGGRAYKFGARRADPLSWRVRRRRLRSTS